MKEMGTMTEPTPVVVVPVQPVNPQSAASPGLTAASVRPTRRLAAELEWHWRLIAVIVAIGTLAYAFVLAWHETSEGIATAAAFTVALFALIFALAGVVPASVKIGDVEFQLRQAESHGKAEGTAEGHLEGIKAGTRLATKVCEGTLDVADVKEAVTTALTSDTPIDLPDAHVQVPNLQNEVASAQANEIANSLQVIAEAARGNENQ
jgi:hypothetical protein